MKVFLALFLGIVFLMSDLAFGDDEYKTQGRFSGTMKTMSKTQIDFNETLIEGKMKAPSGFFIQGRQTQSMSQMVRLRSGFRNKLIQSRYGVRAIVK